MRLYVLVCMLSDCLSFMYVFIHVAMCVSLCVCVCVCVCVFVCMYACSTDLGVCPRGETGTAACRRRFAPPPSAWRPGGVPA